MYVTLFKKIILCRLMVKQAEDKFVLNCRFLISNCIEPELESSKVYFPVTQTTVTRIVDKSLLTVRKITVDSL